MYNLLVAIFKNIHPIFQLLQNVSLCKGTDKNGSIQRGSFMATIQNAHHVNIFDSLACRKQLKNHNIFFFKSHFFLNSLPYLESP